MGLQDSEKAEETQRFTDRRADPITRERQGEGGPTQEDARLVLRRGPQIVRACIAGYSQPDSHDLLPDPP